MKSSDAIAVLGGGLVKDKGGKWRTTNFNEGDNFGAMGDRLRVVAAGFLYKKYKKKIIVLGGRGQLSVIPGSPAVSEAIKKELIKLGVNSKDIVCEKFSGNTFQQLTELGKIFKKEKLGRVILVTNKWQMPRVKAMLKHNPVLTKAFSYCKLAFKSAESVLLEYDPKTWKKLIATAYKSDAIKKRIALEKAGVKQIKEGTYNYVWKSK